MKVRVLRTFQDLKDKKRREVGEEFTVSRDRVEEINKAGLKFFGEDLVEVIIEEKK